jgi:uncharacterized SAM-binding protein YcdF (DUF218 family)
MSQITIFFILSKLVGFFLDPLNWILISAFVLYYAVRKHNLPLVRRITLSLLTILLCIGYLPLSDAPLRFLESSAPTPPIDPQKAKGIIVLGGAVYGGILTIERNEVEFNRAAARMTKTVELARLFPHLEIIFTGGSSAILPQSGCSEAESARRFFTEQGIETHRVRYENQSRNTYENAVFTKKLLATSNQPWILITSASHMHRAHKIFLKAGLPTLPLPVAYQTTKTIYWRHFELSKGFRDLKTFLHECIGILAYQWTGKM